MNFAEIRNNIRENLLKAVGDVEDTFIHPDEMAELNGSFPYAVFVFGEGEFEGRRVSQPVSIICFVKGDKYTIADQLDEVERTVFNKLYNLDPKIKILSSDKTNLFKPFGLDAGVFPPYGGIRIEGTVPYVIEKD